MREEVTVDKESRKLFYLDECSAGLDILEAWVTFLCSDEWALCRLSRHFEWYTRMSASVIVNGLPITPLSLVSMCPCVSPVVTVTVTKRVSYIEYSELVCGLKCEVILVIFMQNSARCDKWVHGVVSGCGATLHFQQPDLHILIILLALGYGGNQMEHSRSETMREAKWPGSASTSWVNSNSNIFIFTLFHPWSFGCPG